MSSHLRNGKSNETINRSSNNQAGSYVDLGVADRLYSGHPVFSHAGSFLIASVLIFVVTLEVVVIVLVVS